MIERLPPDDQDDNGVPNFGVGDWATYRRLVLAELSQIRRRLDEFENTFVKQVEFFPIKMFVFSLIGIIMTAVFTAVLALVLRGKL